MSELLLARAAIADLVHRYALQVRSGEGIDCTEFFTEDATFEVREALIGKPGPARTRSRLEGHAAIGTYIGRTSAPESRVCPLISNLLIEVDDNKATSSCVMTSIVWATGRQLVGEYRDSYRLDDAWRFTSRTFTILGEIAAPQL